jgi:hypothetical protein
MTPRKKTVLFLAVLVVLSSGVAIAANSDRPFGASLDAIDQWLNKEPGYNLGLGPLADWKVTPGFSYKTAYDSNIYREPNGYRNDDVIMKYAPSLEVARETQAFKMKSKYEMEFEEYLEHPEDNNSFNHRWENSLKLSRERLSFKADDKTGYVKTFASSEQTERERIIYNYLDTELAYKLTDKYSVSAIYRNNLLGYISSAMKQFSSDQHLFGGRTYYHVTPKFDLYFQGLADFVHYYRNGSYNSKGFTLNLGSRGVLAEKLRMSIETGFKARDYHNTDVKDYYNWTVEGILEYLMTKKLTLRVRGLRDIEPSVYENVGYYNIFLIGFDLIFKLTEKMKVNAGGGYQNNRYPKSTPVGDGSVRKRDDDFASATVGYTWEPYQTVALNVGYTFTIRDSNFNNFDYNDHYVESSLALKF